MPLTFSHPTPPLINGSFLYFPSPLYATSSIYNDCTGSKYTEPNAIHYQTAKSLNGRAEAPERGIHD